MDAAECCALLCNMVFRDGTSGAYSMDQYHQTTFSAEAAEPAENICQCFLASSARSALIVVINRY